MRLRDIGLSTRITFWVLLFVVAGGLFWIDKEGERQQEVSLKDRSADIEAALDVEQTRMRQAISDMRQDVLFLANVPPVSGMLRASANNGIDPRDNNSYAQWETRLQDIFAAYLRTHPEYFQLRYIAAAGEGRELVRVTNDNGRVEASPPERLQAMGNQDYFRNGLMQASGRVHLSEFTLSHDRSQDDGAMRPTLRAVTTVFDANGRVFGMVVLNRDAGSLLAAPAGALPRGVRSYVADQYGRYLQHPDARHAFAFESGGKESIVDDFPVLQPLLDPQGKQDRLGLRLSGKGADGYLVAKRVYFDPGNPARFLLLVYHLPLQGGIEQLPPASNLLQPLLAMLLVSAVFMLMLRHTFAPLKRITAAARKIAAGDRQVRLAENGKAEIGELAEALNIMLDKLADSELIRQENELRRSIIETAHDGYMLIDALGHLLEVNQAYAAMTGYSMEELLGMHICQLEAHGRTQEEVMTHIVQFIAEGNEVFETRYRHKNGHEIDIEVSITHLHDTQKFVAFCRDITVRKKIQIVQQRYKQVVDTAMDGFWMTDKDGYLEEVNEAYSKISGYSMEELVGMHISQLEAKEIAEETREHIEKIMLVGYDRFETRHRRKDGRVVDIEVAATFMQETEKLFVFCHNITLRKQAEQDLRVAAATFETHEAILITDADANIIRVNRAFSEITGFAPQDVLGRNPRLMSSGRHDKEFYVAMWQRILEAGSWAGEIWDKRKNGEIYPKWMTITAVKNERGETTQYVAIFQDITERKRAEEEIRNLAFYDALTALPNRRLFLERFHTAMAASVRYADYGAVLFIDLDRFKTLNDTLGHDYGDQLLVEVAVRIKSCVREIDTVARFGGDEFVVLLGSLSNDLHDAAHKAGTVAEKIRETLSRPYQLKEHEHHSTPSIGISMFSGNGESIEALLKQADAAMYQSKESGRNALRFFDAGLQQDWETQAGNRPQ